MIVGRAGVLLLLQQAVKVGLLRRARFKEDGHPLHWLARRHTVLVDCARDVGMNTRWKQAHVGVVHWPGDGLGSSGLREGKSSEQQNKNQAGGGTENGFSVHIDSRRLAEWLFKRALRVETG